MPIHPRPTGAIDPRTFQIVSGPMVLTLQRTYNGGLVTLNERDKQVIKRVSVTMTKDEVELLRLWLWTDKQ